MDLSLDEIIKKNREEKKRRAKPVVVGKRRFRGASAAAKRGGGASRASVRGRASRGGMSRQSFQQTNAVLGKGAAIGRAKQALQRARQRLQGAQRQTVAQGAQIRRQNAREAALMQKRGLSVDVHVASRLGTAPRGRGQQNRGPQYSAAPRNIQRRGGKLFTSRGFGRGRLAMDAEYQRVQQRTPPIMQRGGGAFRSRRGRGRGRGGAGGRPAQSFTAPSLQVQVANPYYGAAPYHSTASQQRSPQRGRGGRSSSRQSLLEEARAVVQALSRKSRV